MKAASPVFVSKQAETKNETYKKKLGVISPRVFKSKGKCGAYYEKSPVAVPIKTASPVKATSPRVFKTKNVSPVKAASPVKVASPRVFKTKNVSKVASPRVFKTKTTGKTTVKKTLKPVVTASPVAFVSKGPVTDVSQQIQDGIRKSSVAIRKSIRDLHSRLNVLNRKAKTAKFFPLKVKAKRAARKNIRRSLRKERKSIRRSLRKERKSIRRSIATARKNILRSLQSVKKA